MKSTIQIGELGRNPSKVVRQAEQNGVVNITRNGGTVAFLVSRDTMEGILETVELQANEEFMKIVRRDKAGTLKFKPMPDEDQD